MKQVLSFIFLLLSTIVANAQMPAGGTGSAGRQMPKAKVYGKIIDGKTGKAIDGASVVFMQVTVDKETPVKAGITEANGEFMLEELPMMGSFKLIVTSIGYEVYSQPVAFDLAALMKAGQAMQQSGNTNGIPDNASSLMALMNKDLGNIRIKASDQNLEGVTVVAQTPQFALQGEKKVFNVEKNLVTQGGTAEDVMKNVPGVQVDADGKVSIRNNGPLIMVDGRQTTLQLSQIPADAIESVEVITNPSAKYDAEGGSGGVLNIVLKKNRKQGYNGSLRAGVDSRGGGNGGGDFNYRSGKINVSLNAFGNLMRNRTEGTTTRNDFSDAPTKNILQEDLTKMNGGFAFGRVGLDYFITNRTTLSVGAHRVHGEFNPDVDIHISTDTIYSPSITQGFSRRITDGNHSFDAWGLTAGMKRIFAKPGMEWTVDVNYNANTSDNDNRYHNMSFADEAETIMTEEARQRISGNGKSSFFTAQSDFTYPMGNGAKIDFGIKAIIRNLENNTYNSFFDEGADDYVVIPSNNSDYKNKEQNFAAYVTHSGNFNAATSYSIGLRAERYFYEGELTKTGETFTNDYPVSLFPSLALTRKLKANQQLQLTYRRGITRPNFFQQLPFIDYADPLNIRQGNPALKPEFTHTAELTYTKNFKGTNYFMASAYYRRAENLITAYQSLTTNPFTGQEAVITSYINANNSQRYGLELTAGWDLFKWWNVLGNVNLYNAQLVAPDLVNDNNYFSGFAKVSNSFKLPWKLTAQLTGNYQSRTNLLPDSKGDGPRGGGPMMQQNSSAQGYMEPIWFADIAIRRAFLKGDALSISLSVNDIFGTRRYKQHTESAYFIQDYDRLTNPHLFRLNVSWRFGKMDTDLFRRKNIKGQMENMNNASEGMGY